MQILRPKSRLRMTAWAGGVYIGLRQLAEAIISNIDKQDE
jgi:hypothetical protein